MTNIINDNGYIKQIVGDLSENDLIMNPDYSGWRIATDKDLQAYESVQQQAQNNANIVAQIANLETSQARAIREMLIDSNDFAKQKLTDINNQIAELRKQLIS